VQTTNRFRAVAHDQRSLRIMDLCARGSLSHAGAAQQATAHARTSSRGLRGMRASHHWSLLHTRNMRHDPRMQHCSWAHGARTCVLRPSSRSSAAAHAHRTHCWHAALTACSSSERAAAAASSSSSSSSSIEQQQQQWQQRAAAAAASSSSSTHHSLSIYPVYILVRSSVGAANHTDPTAHARSAVQP
jgi:hypothetical protein